MTDSDQLRIAKIGLTIGALHQVVSCAGLPISQPCQVVITILLVALIEFCRKCVQVHESLGETESSCFLPVSKHTSYSLSVSPTDGTIIEGREEEEREKIKKVQHEEKRVRGYEPTHFEWTTLRENEPEVEGWPREDEPGLSSDHVAGDVDLETLQWAPEGLGNFAPRGNFGAFGIVDRKYLWHANISGRPLAGDPELVDQVRNDDCDHCPWGCPGLTRDRSGRAVAMDGGLRLAALRVAGGDRGEKFWNRDPFAIPQLQQG